VSDAEVEGLLRRLAPRVLGAVVRRYGHFDTAEDAVQEAMLAAATTWPEAGVPDDPAAWLITVAARRLTDLLRNEQARRRREDAVARWTLPEHWSAPAADLAEHADDTLVVLFMCCHPALSPASQIALTLRAVGGLTTAEIARAFLVPESTMTRRITRAKQSVKDSGLPFRLPPPKERAARLAAVLHVLYLIFNEGYASTGGPGLYRVELSAEAIRLARVVHQLLPGDGEAAGLLALMLLTDARRPARTGPDGALIPMAEQDRGRWNADQIAEGVALVSAVLPRGTPGPYQLQAAIAAVHDEAPSAAATDWAQIVALYGALVRLDPSPVVQLNLAAAVAMADGPAQGLALMDTLAASGELDGYPYLPASRADLLRRLGRWTEAVQAYEAALALTTNAAERTYLERRLGTVRAQAASGATTPPH
jgi:RNA polymerase sigma factor (sigma-70 family)